MTQPKYTVVYFDSRGRAESIRLLLHLAGVPFTDVGMARDQIATMKAESPLGQFPYLIEHGASGDVRIPQTPAILRHLSRVHGLYGKDEAEHLATDIAAETVGDVRMAFYMVRFSPAWADPAAREKFAAEGAPVGLGRLDKVLGDRTWFAGSTPTWADVLAFDTLDVITHHYPTLLAGYPRLNAFMNRFHELPQLADYLAHRRPAS